MKTLGTSKHFLTSLILLFSLSQSSWAAQTVYTNPLLTTGNADPCIVPDNNGTYYLYTTGDNRQIKYHSSTNLVSWTSKPTTIWKPSDGQVNVWAPDIKWDPALGKYVGIFTRNFFMSAATGTSLTSRFTDVPVGQFPDKNGSIDPFLFFDWDGKVYLYYSIWSNAGGWMEIYGRQLPTSTSWDGNQKDHTMMIRYSGPSEGEHPGYKPLVEGPEVWRDRDTYYMIYSNADWAGPDYRTCYAIAKSPLGPWVKAANNPLIVRNDAKGIYGPGHGGNFTDAAGRLWYMYQQRPDATTSSSTKRQMCIDRLIMDPVTRLLTLTPTRGTSVSDGPITYPGNSMPTCTITAPAYGSAVAVGSAVNITVSASDSGGSISKVEIFVNNALIATDTNAPYSHTWTASEGVNWIEAKATDNTGAVVQSRAVKITGGNQPPTVRVVRPIQDWVGKNRAEYIEIDAVDPDGTVVQVNFYASDILIGTDTSAPFTCTYSVPNASYVLLKAVATDNHGLSGEFTWPIYPWDKSAQTPFNGVKPIPGTWEAEDFDAIVDTLNPGDTTPDPQYNATSTETNPSRNIGFYKRTEGWGGASPHRPNTRVTISSTADSAGTYDLSEIENGDWYEYTCNVAWAGYYDVIIRASVWATGNKLLITMDGEPLQASGFAELPASGGYADITIPHLYMPAGQRRLRLNFITATNRTMKLNRITTAVSASALYSISGSVAIGGSPLAGVSISDGGQSTNTDGSGNYTLSGRVDGLHTLTPYKPGYQFTPTSLAVSVAGANVTGKNFAATLSPPSIVAGQVVNAEISKPVSYQINAAAAITGYAWVSGTMPPGLTLDPATGMIDGIPTAEGSYTPFFTATNSQGTSPPVSISIVVGPIALIAHEPFDYASGATLAGQAAPAPLGSWTGSATVNDTGLNYNDLAVSGLAAQSDEGGRAFIPVGSNVTSGVRYISFLASNLGTAGLYATLEFRIGTTSDTDNRFVVGVSNDGNSGGEFIMQRSVGGGGSLFSKSGVPRDNGTHLFVVKIDYTGGAGNHQLSWWLDPVIGFTEPAVTGTLTGDFSFSDIAVAKFGVAPNAVFDEIRIGLTFASVTPLSSTEPGTGLTEFRAAYGLAFDGSDDLLTPAGDGVPNLFKYAFNMLGAGSNQASDLDTPNVAVLAPGGSAGLPFVGIGSGPDAGKLQITYIRRRAAHSPSPGISYTVEFSSDLGLSDPWRVNPAATETATSIDATFERVTVTDSSTLTRRFAQVKVTAQ